MKIPDFKGIAQCQLEGRSRGYSTGIHPIPYFYKYYWWVFWRESPVDIYAFLTDQYRLCTADAMALLKMLSDKKEVCWLYNT